LAGRIPPGIVASHSFHCCTKVVLKRGKLVNSQNLMFHFNTAIQELEQGKTY
jgi:hypothetical protein